jgi:iron complex transport system substrate-binding protein
MSLRSIISRIGSLSLMGLMLYCGFAHADEPLVSHDRVISVGGVVTEIVYQLGEGHRLVADDTSSIYPVAAQKLPKVGYQRTLSAEGILGLHPDVVLASDMAGPEPVLQQVKASGTRVVSIATPHDEAGVLQQIQQIADVLGVPAKGRQVVADVRQQFAALKQPVAWKKTPRLLFVLQMGGAPMIAGLDTAPDQVFKLAGAVNSVTAFHGYKPLTPEALLSAAPDAIVVTDQGMSRGGAASVWQIPALARTPAGQAQRLVHLDALLALGLGPRTPEAVRQLQHQLAGFR